MGFFPGRESYEVRFLLRWDSLEERDILGRTPSQGKMELCQQACISPCGPWAEWKRAPLPWSRRKPVPWCTAGRVSTASMALSSHAPCGFNPCPAHSLSSSVHPGCPKELILRKSSLIQAVGVDGILLGPSVARTEWKGTRCVLTLRR